MRNGQVARILYEVAALLELENMPFKPRAYRRAARSVEACSTPIEEMVASDRLRELPDVGEAIAGKIEEIVRTGGLRYHQELKAKLPIDLFDLMQVHGVGPKTAKRLYEALGVRNLLDLERAAKEGRIRGVPGMGIKTERRILKGLAETRGAGRRELLWYALGAMQLLVHALDETGLFSELSPAGSLRRGAETVGDLDLLGVTDRPEEAARAFARLPDVEEVLLRGPKRTSVRLTGGLRADLRIVPASSYGAALQYFTGSKAHNIRLRERAGTRGMKLNEYALTDADDRVVAGEDEEGVYRRLGLVWIPPELREDQGEIQAAERGALPELAERSDVLGDLHVHTDWSDGTAGLEAMVAAARDQGLVYVAVTDHYRFSSTVNGVTADDLVRQIDAIAELNASMEGIRVLTGIEANIDRAGGVDVPSGVLRRLDIVIASVHSHFRLSSAEMTRRLERVMDNELVDVLGHPTGRLIGERPPYDADWDEVFYRAAKTGTAIEINANPQRLDLNALLTRRALEAGVRLALGSDAHAPDHIRFLEMGVRTARRGWAEAKHMLNALPVDALLATRKRGGG